MILARREKAASQSVNLRLRLPSYPSQARIAAANLAPAVSPPNSALSSARPSAAHPHETPRCQLALDIGESGAC